MHRSYSYFMYAENDFKFLVAASESEGVYNGICYTAAEACKKYMLHVLDINKFNEKTLSGVSGNSLIVIAKFIHNNVDNFHFDWNLINKMYEYEKHTRFPNVDSYIVSKSDVETAMLTITKMRDSVKDYIEYVSENGLVTSEGITDAVEQLRKLQEFSKNNENLIW